MKKNPISCSFIDVLPILCCALAMLNFFVDIIFRIYYFYHLSTTCCCNYHYQVVSKSPQRRSSLESVDNDVPNKYSLNNTKSANELDGDKTDCNVVGADASTTNSLPDVAANNIELPNVKTVSEGAYIFILLICFISVLVFFLLLFLIYFLVITRRKYKFSRYMRFSGLFQKS